MSARESDQKCIEKLFKYTLSVNEDLKSMKLELDETKQQFKNLEDELTSSRKSLTDENSKLQQQLEGKDEKIRKLANELDITRRMLFDTRQKSDELEKRNATDAVTHKKEMESMECELDRNQEALKLSAKFVLYFGEKLQHLGHIGNDASSMCYKVLKFRSKNKDFDLCSAFLGLSYVPFSPTSPPVAGDSLDVVKLEPSSELHDAPPDNSNVQQDCSGSTNEGEDQNPCSAFSEVNQPSTSTSMTLRETPRNSESNYLSFKNSLLRKSNAVDKRMKPRPSESMVRALQSGISSTPLNVSPNITFEDNRQVLISFPITPSLKRQSVTLNYLDDRVNVGYKQVRKETDGSNMDISVPQQTSETEMDSDVINLDSDTDGEASVVVNSQDSEMSSTLSHSSESVLSRTKSVAPNNQSGGMNASSNVHAEGMNVASDSAEGCGSRRNFVTRQSTLDSTLAALVSGLKYCPPSKTKLNSCPDVVRALKPLAYLCNDESQAKNMTDSLKAALVQLKKEQEPHAINDTIQYIISRTNHPLIDYMESNDANKLIPIDEQCILKAYSTIGRPDLKAGLDSAIYEEITKNIDFNRLPIHGFAALCRVYTSFRATRKSYIGAKSLCYLLFKKCVNYAPYIVANIAGVWPDLFLSTPVGESEICLYKAVCYLMTNKPDRLSDSLWQEASNYIEKQLHIQTGQSPEEVIRSTIHSIIVNSKKSDYGKRDSTNYITAVELVTTRFDWSWIRVNIVARSLLPFIESFATTARKKSFGASILIYRLIGLLGAGNDEDENIFNVVKSTMTKLSDKKLKIPDHILDEARLAMFRLQSGLKHIDKSDEMFLRWVVSDYRI